ncbi:sigma-70 family RNA polymerase sigma factor [Paenibacillus albidus]|uniref:sigma-70 family RNA polymerase sigma factor n=1 Tax=Paenibacillus albidus TaxID=2041023 RepID=UPI001BECBF9B|nr:sigma-70 family RNA polymerase sigma factor [Paenibacillus albidus]MBT2292776.1 sigma-70 family RNA polymerase sigma factor [Paenibacillus albidus]
MEVIQGKVDRYKPTERSNEAMMSKEEFTQMYDTYYQRVYKYICYRINNHHAAEDICSQVFESVMCKYYSFSQEKSNFEVWLFAIVRNAVTDYYRAQKKRSYSSLDSLLELIFPKPSPEELAIREDDNQALFKALAKLREKERNLIAMKYGAGLKNAEIAQIMGVSESNIGVVLYRSLKKLHVSLKAGGFNNE